MQCTRSAKHGGIWDSIKTISTKILKLIYAIFQCLKLAIYEKLFSEFGKLEIAFNLIFLQSDCSDAF